MASRVGISPPKSPTLLDCLIPTLGSALFHGLDQPWAPVLKALRSHDGSAQVADLRTSANAEQTLPRYEIDSGPLTGEQKEEIRRLQPSGRMKRRESLF